MGYSNDPVNTASGCFLVNEEDLPFTGPAAPLTVVRAYSSLNPAVGAFGPGWSWWTEAGLVLTDDAARLTLADGFPAHLDLVDAGQAQAFVRAQKRQGCFLPVRRARGALSVRAKVCFFAAPQWFFTQVCRDRPLLRAYSARGRCECGSLT